ncbi:putative C6 transcription factor [Talaromyces proteolyticus]|uniref:C6 transcription factor n=1 Tax=Talaromyces proteolyticus TaxID=1131652 RepID=A0AAD4PU89_9EURO|nr:putative C6 transcription factor [Talaromyces proteolyticus]KAH8691975.1 putative C6 transcription factor [Talaromyces proteolyticus]
MSIARKCSLPVRQPVTGSNILPADGRPIEVSEEKSDEYALRAFFYEYNLVSSHQATSRGFLRGLERAFYRHGPHSNLARACRLVASATYGIKLCRPFFLRQADQMYHDLLSSLAISIDDLTSVSMRDESILVAILLGLYEIIITDESCPGYHNAHAAGVAAMLRVKNTPLDLLQALRNDQSFVSKRLLQTNTRGLFAIPQANGDETPLDNLLFQLGTLWKRTTQLDILPHNVLSTLRSEALYLDESFSLWENTQNKYFRPSTIYCMSSNEKSDYTSIDVGYWPGNIDTYVDHYIAGVWNTYRAARLVLLDIILKLSHALKCGTSHDAEHKSAQQLVKSILASIPYSLTEDLHIFLRDIEINQSIANPGRAACGLLLMHTIHVTANLSIVDPAVRTYLNECLIWIGKHMGIGQAAYLATNAEVDPEYFAGSCMIVLFGLLV